MEILLADDDSEVRSTLASLLEAGGHRVTAVGDGRSALALLSRRRFDHLVTDLEMPGMDGIALISAARTEQPGLPAVLVSSHPDAASLALPLGVPVLAKPCKGPNLLATLAGPPLELLPSESSSPDTLGSAVVVGGSDSLVPRRPSQPIRANAMSWAWGLAAIALLALSPWFVELSFVDRAPALPALPEAGATRGAALEILEPSGPLAAPPTQLRWLGTDEAAHHLVIFERVDGQVIFRHTAERRRDGAGADIFDLPDDFAATLRPMVIYHWWVEALDAEGALISSSPRQRFRILADAHSSSPSSTGDSP